MAERNEVEPGDTISIYVGEDDARAINRFIEHFGEVRGEEFELSREIRTAMRVWRTAHAALDRTSFSFDSVDDMTGALRQAIYDWRDREAQRAAEEG